MPYVFEETQAGEPRPASEFPSLPSEVYEETFAQAFEENPIAAMSRAKSLADDYRSGGKRLDLETATQRLKERGMEGDIRISEAGITEQALNTLMYRKGVERRRQEVFGQAEGGFAQGAARIGVALGTSLIDPVNIATAFIPVIGEARYTSMLARSGSTLGRAGVRAGVGAVEGVAGAALLEPIIAGSRRYEQADYDMSDSLLNIAFGGVFGAGLHSIGGAISDGVRYHSGASPSWKGLEGVKPDEIPLVRNLRQEIERGMDARDVARVTETWSPEAKRAVEADIPKVTPAEAAHQALPPQVRENMLKQAIVQAVSGEPVNVQPIIDQAATRQTDTPEFRQWFGESKVVDEAGVPLVVNHGTWADFDEFDFGRLGETTDANVNDPGSALAQTARIGAWFSSENVADSIGAPKTVKAYLSLQNPREFNSLDDLTRAIEAAGDAAKLRNSLESEGHDGIRVTDEEIGGTSYVAFRPNQIKSAIGNSGRFDPNSASLTDAIDDPVKAVKYAEKVLARETDTGTPTADALKMATEEATLAQSDLKAVADRLGLEAEDAELRDVLEAAANSERWAKAAELATICLTRGG